MASTPEGRFKTKTKKKLVLMFPGCYLHEMKCGDQGIPDTLILYRNKWALLEFKESETAKKRPNQKYYVDLFDSMGFSSFIYPENETDVLRQLSLYFGGDPNGLFEDRLQRRRSTQSG